MFSNRYIFIYATVMIVIVASILATASSLLKPLQDMNIKNEKYKNILVTAKAMDEKQKIKGKELEDLYFSIITESYAINSKGEVLDGIDAFNIDMASEVRKPIEGRMLPVFVATLPDGEKEYIIPLRGRGLWGPIWGYIAIKQDGKTVAGISFGHKGETPGLGAEIVNQEFTDQFSGKKIFDDKFDFTSVKVIKSARADDPHAVDGISGGTITCNGVDEMLYDCIKAYKVFFTSLNN